MMIKYYGSYPNVICLKFVMVSKKPLRSAEQPRLGLRGPVLSLNFQDGDSGFPLTTRLSEVAMTAQVGAALSVYGWIANHLTCKDKWELEKFSTAVVMFIFVVIENIRHICLKI